MIMISNIFSSLFQSACLVPTPKSNLIDCKFFNKQARFNFDRNESCHLKFANNIQELVLITFFDTRL